MTRRAGPFLMRYFLAGASMKGGDFVSLFQLSVALNLGFGALISFGEPLKQRVIRKLGEHEVLLEELLEQNNSSSDEIEAVYKLSSHYLEIRRDYHSIIRQWDVLDLQTIHTVVIVCAIVSFIGLLLCSVESDY